MGLSLPSAFRGRCRSWDLSWVCMNILQASQETEEMGLRREASAVETRVGHLHLCGEGWPMSDTGGLPHEYGETLNKPDGIMHLRNYA